MTIPKNEERFNVIGIDPSLSATGIALADGSTVTVKERGLTGDKRLVLLYLAVLEAAVGVDLAVIEDLPTHAMSAGITGRAQGVVRLALQQAKVPYIALPPATLKKAATGKGNAKKDAMREAMENFTGRLPKSVDDNQVDAFWLQQCGYFLARQVGYIHVDGEPGLDKYRAQVEELLNGAGG